MIISNNSSTSFGAKVSPYLKIQLAKQVKLTEAHKKTGKKLSQQLLNVENWGSDNSEIVISKNLLGNYCLGLKLKFNVKGFELTMPIEPRHGRTELSQFLNLTEENIKDTENSIKYLYHKFGTKVFDKFLI